MDTGAGGQWDLQVEYWDPDVAQISEDRVSQGWILSMCTKELVEALPRAMDLEREGRTVRIVWLRPEVSAPLPPPRSYPE